MLNLIAAMLAAVPVVALPQQPTAAPVATTAPLTPAERARVLAKLADLLEQRYVFPDVARRYAAMLRARIADHAYDALNDPGTLAARLTADLQAVAPDLHLRVGIESSFHKPRAMPADTPQSARPSGPPGIEAAEVLPGDIAYLRFNAFPDDPQVAERARAFLLAHRHARAVILDSRPNRGGGAGVMNAILPLFYDRPTVQARMDTRASVEDGSAETDPTLVRRASAPEIVRYDHVIRPDATTAALRHVPLYYLTSRRTGSAAEHLALALKRNHRATLVGETTIGANHFGVDEALGAGLIAFLPVGRAYDPDTGKDWEGVGIAPDVAVPADAALATALAMARRHRRAAGVR